MNLPKVSFDVDLVKVIDRHGRDITDLLIVKEAGMSARAAHGMLEARLVLVKKDWFVESEGGLSEKTRIFQVGYDLSDGLQPNTIDEHFPQHEHRTIEITFDAVWGTP